MDLFFSLGKNTQIVGQEEDFWKVPVLDVNPFFFLEDKINELFYWDQANLGSVCTVLHRKSKNVSSKNTYF